MKEKEFTFEYLTSRVNEAILSGKFPDSLKFSNIVLVHKKKDPTDKLSTGQYLVSYLKGIQQNNA